MNSSYECKRPSANQPAQLRPTRRQPRSGQHRPAWPGNAMNGLRGRGTP